MNSYPFCSIFLLAAALIPPILGLDSILTSGYHDTQRVAQIIALITILLLSIIKSNITFFDVFLVLSGIGIYFIHATPQRNNYHLLFEITISLAIFLASIKVSNEFHSNKDDFFKTTIKLIILGSFLYVATCIASYCASMTSDIPFAAYNLIPGYDNYRFFNHTQTTTTGLLLFSIAKEREIIKSKIWLIVAWFTLTSWWTLLLISAGRGTLVGLLFAFIVLLSFPRKTHHWIKAFALSFIIGCIVYYILFKIIPSYLDKDITGEAENIIARTRNNILSSREYLWKCALENFSKAPLFGTGPMSFSRICAKINNGAHPHNIFIQILSEWGIAFTLLLLAAIYKPSRMILNDFYSDKTKDIEITTLLIFIFTTILIDSLVSGIFVMPTSQIYISFYLGIFIGNYRKESKAAPRLFSFICLIGVIVLLALSSLKTFEYSIESKLKSSFPRDQLSPRAWSYGYFE